LTFALACASSCLNDSISDGLSRLEVCEVACFGLSERVESVAGCGFEVGFKITMLFTKGLQSVDVRMDMAEWCLPVKATDSTKQPPTRP